MHCVRRITRSEHGSSLIEMMIAMVVLAIGLLGSMALVSVSVGSNSRSRSDSTSTALAEMIIGQLSAVPAGGATATLTVTDCAGNANTTNTTGTTTGTGATLNTNGNIDFTQAFAAVPAGYAMKYTVCGVSNGTTSMYDVRWNITKTASTREEYVVVGAQLIGSNGQNPRFYAAPVNVRTVVGNQGN